MGGGTSFHIISSKSGIRIFATQRGVHAAGEYIIFSVYYPV